VGIVALLAVEFTEGGMNRSTGGDIGMTALAILSRDRLKEVVVIRGVGIVAFCAFF
jgi:hypothetical protein